MAHAPLDQARDLVRVLERDIQGRLADHRHALVQEDGGGREHLAVPVGQGHRLAAVVERCNRGERCAQIDSDELACTFRHGHSSLGHGPAG